MRSLVMSNNHDGTFTSYSPISYGRHNDRLHSIRVYGVPIPFRPVLFWRSLKIRHG